MQETPLEIIEKQVARLSLYDHIKLIETLARQLRQKNTSGKQRLNWTELYGLGKGLWVKEDAQGYVNKLREDRI
jgi:hypothetical protein